MTRSDGPPLPPLDDVPGPARAVPRQALRAMRDRIVDRDAGARQPRPVAWRALRPLHVAAGVLLALAVVGSAAAAVRSLPALRAYWQASPARPAPAAVRKPQRPPEVAAAHEHVAPVVAAQAPASAAPVLGPEPQTRAFTDLLERANRLRAQRRWRAAEALYVQALEQQAALGPRSAAALAAAELRLSQLGRPRAALAMFERALRLDPDGPLAEQGRHGIAQAYRALGEAHAEERALEAFVAAHPHSTMRARAEERLRALRE